MKNNTNKNTNENNGFTISKNDYEFMVKRGNEILDELFGEPLRLIEEIEKNEKKRES